MTLPASPPLSESAVRDYEAARSSAVVADLSRRGRVQVTGRDRVDLLQRLTTNDMKAIAPGGGVPNLFLTNKGRIVEMCDILAFPEHLLLVLASEDAPRMLEWIERFVFMEQVTAADVTGETCHFGVFGPQAGAVVAAAGGVDGAALAGLAARDHRAATIGGAEVVVGRAEPLAGAGFRVIGKRADAEAIESALMAGRGVRRADPQVLDVLRIEAGWPGAGRELTEHWNPLDAELRWVVSFTKGCYTGQEVVARLTTYKKVQRALRGLRITGRDVPAFESKVRQGGAEVGVVTSAAWSPGLDSVIALAYIDLAQSPPGTAVDVELELDGGRAVAAETAALPFAGSGVAAPAPEARDCR
jgi:tRNA-modifying protein YgfZ